MNGVGSLAVSASLSDGRLDGFATRLQRPQVSQLFIGQVPEAVVKTVPYLYTLCAQAQRAAAQAALSAAMGEAPRPCDDSALWGEMLHEHLWRLLLDWPQALGLMPARDALVTWRGARSGGPLAAATAEVLADTLLGVLPQAWQGEVAAGSLAARCLAHLGGGADDAGFDLPQLTPQAWLPYWRGEAADPPPPLRPASVAGAYRARLAETVYAALALAADASYPVAAAGGDGWGIGQTLTARGVLTHGARVEAGRVSAYKVWAPTDCHFAEPGDLAALLAEGSWPDLAAAKRGLEQAVLALDPCLPYELKVSHA